jgi:hypothetical protein
MRKPATSNSTTRVLPTPVSVPMTATLKEAIAPVNGGELGENIDFPGLSCERLIESAAP